VKKSFYLFLVFLFQFALPGQVTAQVREHIVQNNQTLYSIARMYNTSVNNLLAWNRLPSERIRPGQKLLVQPAQPEQAAPLLEPGTYTVRTGDTLEMIARQYALRPDDLARLNSLETSQLHPGMKLLIRPSVTQVHRVRDGETAFRISQTYGISIEDFLGINSLSSPQLRPGQLVRVRKPESLPLSHEVMEMDSLQSLAVLYNMPVEEIRQLNSMTSDTLIPGQTLRLKEFQSAAIPSLRPAGPGASPTRQTTTATVPVPATEDVFHTVAIGETLYSLARRYQVSVNHLRSWNSLRDNTIRVGMKLRVSDGPAVENPSIHAILPEATVSETQATANPVASLSRLIDIRPPQENEELRWDRYVVLKDDIPLFEWQNDFYYFAHPGQLTQPSGRYYESDWQSPLQAYRKAKRLWDEYILLVNARPRKSSLLEGVMIVIDPGHGGLDPGAIVRSSDGAGEVLYVTEDEYVYDIAMRMVPLLVEHGAAIQFTTLAPNHLIRDTTPATRTLIHEKNEVYNSAAMNSSDSVGDWIVGGSTGLAKRVQIANAAFSGNHKVKLFLSLHADNSPRAPMGLGLYLAEGDRESARLAEQMIPFLGSQAYTKTQELAVLRGNDADFKMLAEVRNVAYQEHSWALRFANTRQLDAERLVRGLLNFFQTRQRNS